MKQRAGFSLVEIIVVVGIVSLAFIGILSLVRRAIMLYYSNQNYLIASMVAQDGLELVRYVRDQNWLTNRAFYNNLSEYNTDNKKTIFAIDYQATADDPATPNIEGRNAIIQIYNDQDHDIVVKDKNGNPVSTCGSFFDNTGNLSQYIKSPCAAIYTDSQKNNFYTEQMVNNISDSDTRYKKTLFSRLVEVTYHTNGTPNPEDDYIYVSSMVYWRDRGSDRYITLGAYLYDYSWKF